MTDKPLKDHAPASALEEWKNGWKLVLACCVGFSFFSIMAISIGVFMGPLSEEFGWSRTLVSAGVTIAAVTTALLSPFVGVVIDRLGARRIALPGLVVTTAAMSAFFLVNGSPYQWLALWGFYALVSATVKTTIWVSAIAGSFQASQGLALGITLCGTAVAQVVVPPVADWLIASFGWRMAYLSIALGWGTVTFLLCWFFLYDVQAVARSRTAASEPTAPSGLRLPGLTRHAAARNSALWRIAVATIVMMTLTMGLAIHLIPILEEAGILRTQAAWLASLGGVAGIVGKLLTGVLLDRFRVNWFGGFTLGITSLAFILLLYGVRSPAMIIAAMIINGYSAGSKLQICSVVTAQHAGMRNFGAIYGVMVSFVAVGTGVGPMIAGMVYDSAGSYGPFLIAGAIGCVVSGLLIYSLPAPPDWRRDFESETGPDAPAGIGKAAPEPA